MAVTLDVTGDVVLTGSDNFGCLFLDKAGALGLDHEELRSIFTRLAKAMNLQHEQVHRLQTEIDLLHGNLHALRQQSTSMELRLSECEDSEREVRVQIDNLRESAQAQVEGNSLSHGQEDALRFGGEELAAVQERCAWFAEQLERLEQCQQEEVGRLETRTEACEDQLRRHQEQMDRDFEMRFTQTDDALLTQKMDLEGLQVSLADMGKRKANKAELSDMQKIVESVLEEQKAESATLKEAHDNLAKLDDCVSLAQDNKIRTEDLWRLFREETQEIREWASRSLQELRTGLRAKMDEVAALGRIDELREEVRSSASHLAQATTRVEADIRQKAGAGDLARLQDTMQELRKHARKPRQLLLGTKCLACDRAMTEDVTLQGAVDAVKERQQEELFREVERALSKSPSGGRQDVLKYVAVHVGSTTRVHCEGQGLCEARDMQDVEGHHLMPMQGQTRSAASSRPGTRGLSSRGSERPASTRSMPREVPPLVRVTPRRPNDPRIAATPRGVLARQEPRPRLSVRQALGPGPAPTRSGSRCGPPGAEPDVEADSGTEEIASTL